MNQHVYPAWTINKKQIIYRLYWPNDMNIKEENTESQLPITHQNSTQNLEGKEQNTQPFLYLDNKWMGCSRYKHGQNIFKFHT